MSLRTDLEHPALLYGGLEEFLDSMVRFVAGGVDNGEVVFVAAHGDYLPPLRAELGDMAAAAHWADTYEWHPHPATRLRAFYELVTDEVGAGATRLRLAAEPVWPVGPPEFVREWQRYESVLNSVLAPFPVTLMCLYDSSRLDPGVLEGVRATHSTVYRNGSLERSREFEEPQDLLPRWNPALSTPPSWATRSEVMDVSAARRVLKEHALRAGVERRRALDLCLAANEIMTNALLYAEGATLVMWTEGERFLCQVEDRGAGIADPLAGYRPPAVEPQGGRGLWMARQLVDLLQIGHRATGTTVRLQMTRAPFL